MIPGLKAIPAFNGAGTTGGGAGGALTLALLATANSSASTITIPSSALAGDWAILFDMAVNATGASISTVVPSGWTALADSYASNGYAGRLTTSHRLLTAGMGGTSITGMNDAGKRKFMLVFRPSTSIASAIASTWNNETTSGDPASQTVTASGVTTPLIVAAVAFAAGSATPPSFTTETPSMTNLTNGGMRIGYTLYNSSPSNQSIDIGGADAVDGLQSGYVRFT